MSTTTRATSELTIEEFIRVLPNLATDEIRQFLGTVDRPAGLYNLPWAGGEGEDNVFIIVIFKN